MVKKLMGMFLVVYVMLFTRVCAADLGTIQTQQIQKLEVVGEKVVQLLDKMEGKVGDKVIKKQLTKKKKEVTVLINRQKKALKNSKSPKERRAILKETQRRVLLKTYAGVTRQRPLTESVRVPGGKKEQQKAVQSVVDIIDQ